MPWNPPAILLSGELVTAAKLNQLRDSLMFAEPVAYTQYTGTALLVNSTLGWWWADRADALLIGAALTEESEKSPIPPRRKPAGLAPGRRLRVLPGFVLNGWELQAARW